MKKLFILGAIVIGAVVSAFPFRTSCGYVVEVKATSGIPAQDLSAFLSYTNYNICGTVPKGLVIYTH